MHNDCIRSLADSSLVKARSDQVNLRWRSFSRVAIALLSSCCLSFYCDLRAAVDIQVGTPGSTSAPGALGNPGTDGAAGGPGTPDPQTANTGSNSDATNDAKAYGGEGGAGGNGGDGDATLNPDASAGNGGNGGKGRMRRPLPSPIRVCRSPQPRTLSRLGEMATGGARGIPAGLGLPGLAGIGGVGGDATSLANTIGTGTLGVFATSRAEGEIGGGSNTLSFGTGAVGGDATATATGSGEKRGTGICFRSRPLLRRRWWTGWQFFLGPATGNGGDGGNATSSASGSKTGIGGAVASISASATGWTSRSGQRGHVRGR